MGPKDKEAAKTVTDDKSANKGNTEKSSTIDFTSFSSLSDGLPYRLIELNITMFGEPAERGEFMLIVFFNKKTILSGKWEDSEKIGIDTLPIDLNHYKYQNLVLSEPLFFILRSIALKAPKADLDPLLHPDNRAGGTVDLLPLLLGEEEVFTTLHLVSKTTGDFYGCQVEVRATSPGTTEHNCVPLLMTMLTANCMPAAKDGTVYISAIGLTDIFNDVSVEFGPSISSSDATKVVWASSSTGGYAANTGYNVPCQDKFVPEDLDPKDSEECLLFHWNAMNRVLVDAEKLAERLTSPFLVEVAGVALLGKVDLRGRYLGLADARALLEPGQLDVTVCVQLFNYSEARANGVGPLLDIPPMSAKTASMRESDLIQDEFGHCSYVVMKFDLSEPLVPRLKFIPLYDIIGFPPPEGSPFPVNQLDTTIKREEPFIDAKFIRKTGGALAVHDELSNLASRGVVPMNQSIKRSAANLLLMRVRTMLKNFPPGADCSYIEWQDTVTGQHAASRRAVTASFAPQPPPPRQPVNVAVARSRIAGDDKLAQKNMDINLKVDSKHPRALICKVLRCLEERNELDAKKYLFDALNNQVNNRYLLWILGAQEFDKGTEEREVASAAFRIAAKGDYSDGTTNAIAWATLHTYHHCIGNVHSAHVAARKMRKSFSLPRKWNEFLDRWRDTSGEEEVIWNPKNMSFDNPVLIAAAFFLCLRCYHFCASLLECVLKDCAIRGTAGKKVLRDDVYYLKAALFVLKKKPECAMEILEEGITKLGPTGLLCQMRVTCLASMRSWDDICEDALLESEKAGARPIPSLLYNSASARFRSEPDIALQRAACCHSLAPSGHTALLIGRIYASMGENVLAQRWCAAAVNVEPLLSDAWAMLSILAMQYGNDLEKARTILRTARQVGTISSDIEKELIDVMGIVQLDKLPDSLVKNMFCEKRDIFAKLKYTTAQLKK